MARATNGMLLLGMGAALMYLLDPQAGRKRRADLKNQIESAQRRARRGADAVVRDATNRTHGALVRTQQELRSLRTRLQTGTREGDEAGLLVRAMANEDLSSAVRGRPFAVDKSLRIDAPPEQVYGYWRNQENFPLWMSHVREVRYIGGNRYHWSVDGPAGVPVEWDAEVTDVSPNREMAWCAVEGSEVQTSGRVRFEPDGAGTRVRVELAYSPPGGAIGHAVAKAFGVDPRSQMDDDLLRVKSLLETGRPPRDSAAQRRIGEGGGAPAAA